MRYLYYQNSLEKDSGGILFRAQQDYHIFLQRRKELKLTQQQVADRAGIQLRQYQRLENGERSITGSSARIMLSICDALKLDPYLFLLKGNEKPETKYVVIPPLENEGFEYVIPSLAYYNLVSAIPRGLVCTDDDLMECLRTAYDKELLEIKTDHNIVDFYINESCPFWRVVSQRGYLINNIYCSKERQKEKLEAEGIKVSHMGENDSYRVDEFEYCRFDINRFKITVMKTEKQIFEQFNQYMESKKENEVD